MLTAKRNAIDHLIFELENIYSDFFNENIFAMTTKTKAAPKWTNRKIEDAYLKTLLTEGKRPTSVFLFADSLGISEEKFYSFFSSFDAIENGIFTDIISKTVKGVKSGEGYNSFTAQEKLLTFYYAHIEQLKANRSLISLKWKQVKKNPTISPAWLKGYRALFLDFSRQIVMEAIANEEIKERPFLSDRYAKAYWVQLAFVVHFWINDDSPEFERTDAAIEKAVNLSFQLLSDTTIDSLFDFAKFMWHSKGNS